MARYNKIFAGPYTEATPQVAERPAAAAITPGQLIAIAAGQFTPAGATTVGKVYVAQDNYLAMEGVDTPYAIGDTVLGLDLLDDQFFNVRVATGVNVARDAALVPGPNGTVALATAGGKQVVATAEEAFNNTSGSAQLVRVRAAKGYLTAAT